MISFDLDKIGVCTSSVCAVHCAAVPVVLIYTSSLGAFAFLDNLVTEMVILGLTVAIGVVAIVPSLLKHRQSYVLVLFLTGVFLVIIAEFVTMVWLGLALSVAGGGLMAYAHFENLKLKSSGRCN